MRQVFEKMASMSGLSQSDFRQFFAHASDLAPAEIGAVLGYLLGRIDSRDAAAMVSVVREINPPHAIKIDGRPTVNMVGTGGGPSTFNITTTAAFVVAAAGVVVVKTGSNACRSKAGFADVAAKLGTLKVTMPWDQIEAIVADVGIVFVPPASHALALGTLEYKLTAPVFRNVAAYMNKIGPLLAPVKVDHRCIGANSASCLEMLTGACRLLGDVPTTLFSADDGLDEVSSMAPTRLIQLTADGARQDDRLDPGSLGIQRPGLDALAGQEPAAAAECCERILSGRGTPAQSDIVALNAAVVLTSMGLFANVSAGFEATTRLIQQGAALAKLHELRSRVWKCAKR
ncbi:MAG TPA: hypothetical protein VGZ26_09325 [Pirellulales bacterium]|nr:hypothetical protein [Pirellulales bacterium]